MTFDLKLMELDPAAVAAGVRLVELNAVGSTNEEARKRLNERGPLWITALSQTRGRGRMGRTWISPQGNLYASLVLHDPSGVEQAPELAFVAALAVRDAVIAEAPALETKLSFKWPNDLLLADEKCAGILIEGEAQFSHTEEFRRLSVIVGIGVNCMHHPPTASPEDATSLIPTDTASYPATDLFAHGADVTSAQLFRRLSATMVARIAQWNSGAGLPAILSDWLSAARGIGEPIIVRDLAREKHGRFTGLDDKGRLLLEVPGGAIETIAAGDVFLFEKRGGRAVPSGAA
jgi:BirA family biotin operon repressor/biotin-[acetyl-CoA-carboxylase] ligase